MSASLPRIKTVQEMPVSGQHVPKFRKLTLNSQNQQERKASLKSLKTERLKSLSRYSTTQEQRQYKNQKIHLNLIERKLLNGTYDDKKETGNQLNALKQKRDHFKVEVALKTREAQRIRNSLNQVKREIEELLERKGEHEKKLEEIKRKYEAQGLRTEAAEEYRSVFEYMLSNRQQIKLNLTKRTNDLKAHLSHLTNISNLLDTELREVSQRLFSRQTKLEALVDEIVRSRNQRNHLIVKHQDAVIKRKEDEQLQSQRSKEYMAELDHLQRLNELKQFHGVYDKILAHHFLDKYCKSTLIKLHTKYQVYEYSYRKLCSYRSFQEEEPRTLVQRFLQHQSEKKEREQKIGECQKYIEELQNKNEKLKSNFIEVQSEELQFSEELTLSQANLNNKEHMEAIERLGEEQKEAEEKVSKVRRIIVKLLNRLNKKGERRANLNEAAQKNMENLNLLMMALANSKTP